VEVIGSGRDAARTHVPLVRAVSASFETPRAMLSFQNFTLSAKCSF